MRIKNKRVLKNGAIAGYVYYKKDKKWKWRIVGHVKNKKGGVRSEGCQNKIEWKDIVFNFTFSDGKNILCPSNKLKKFFELVNGEYTDWRLYFGTEMNWDNFFFDNVIVIKPEVEIKAYICESKEGLDYFTEKSINLNPNNRNSKKRIDFFIHVSSNNYNNYNYNSSNNNNSNN
jgi:hypothetical protein